MLDEQQRFPVSTIKHNDLVDVNVTHIVSPLEFYLAKTSEICNYTRMAKKLQNKYNNKEISQHLIYVPRPEMICAVNVDGIWYRGRLNGIASSERDFHVSLVDVGSIQTVHWDCIRQIDESFRVLPEAVACCYLAHITPTDGLWSPDALVVFKRATKHATRIQADVVEGKPGYHAVVLYEMPANEQPSCINKILVDKGFAQGDVLLLSHPMVDAESLSEDSDSKEENTLSSSVTKDSSSIDQKTRVKIVHIVSPGEFYITLIKNKSAVDQMHHLVTQHMQTRTDKMRNPKWKIGDLCLAKTTILGESLVSCWYRGRVLSIDCEDNSCSVFLCDRGTVVKLDLDTIVPTPEMFKSIRDGAMRCHMFGVQPTNGKIQWSATSIDAFRKVVNDFEGNDIFFILFYRL